MALSMWFNQAKCDIYMGTGAGAKLLKEIGNAQKSVKISSPYISPKMVEELIWLHQKGVEVSLITSDTLENGSRRQEKSIRPLIVQNQHLDESAFRSRNSWIRLKQIFGISTVLSLVGVLAVSFFTENWRILSAILIPALFYVLTKIFDGKIRGKRIYTYSYSSLFPFKVFLAPDSYMINDMFIHGKIYIIDGLTAYLGSLNFTESGTKYNYETRIRVTDVAAVNKIDEEFVELYNHEDLAFFGIEEWGRQLYPEPIN